MLTPGEAWQKWDPLRDWQISPSTSCSLCTISSLGGIVRAVLFLALSPFVVVYFCKGHMLKITYVWWDSPGTLSVVHSAPTAPPFHIPTVTWIKLVISCVSGSLTSFDYMTVIQEFFFLFPPLSSQETSLHLWVWVSQASKKVPRKNFQKLFKGKAKRSLSPFLWWDSGERAKINIQFSSRNWLKVIKNWLLIMEESKVITGRLRS